MNRSITCLRNNNWELLCNPKDISNHQVSFYQHLYSDPSVSRGKDGIPLASEPLQSLPQIDPALSERADKPITEQDLLTALKQMNNGKSPGTDGLTVEFYKFFWPEVGP